MFLRQVKILPCRNVQTRFHPDVENVRDLIMSAKWLRPVVIAQYGDHLAPDPEWRLAPRPEGS